MIWGMTYSSEGSENDVLDASCVMFHSQGNSFCPQGVKVLETILLSGWDQEDSGWNWSYLQGPVALKGTFLKDMEQFVH